MIVLRHSKFIAVLLVSIMMCGVIQPARALTSDQGVRIAVLVGTCGSYRVLLMAEQLHALGTAAIRIITSEFTAIPIILGTIDGAALIGKAIGGGIEAIVDRVIVNSK